MKAPSDLREVVLDDGENDGMALLCSQQQRTAWILAQGDHFPFHLLILQKTLRADSGRGNGTRSKEEGKDGLHQLVFTFFP